MTEQEKLSEIEWRRRMVVEAAANLASKCFLHNNGDGTDSYVSDLEHVEHLRNALLRLKKIAPSELSDYEPPSED